MFHNERMKIKHKDPKKITPKAAELEAIPTKRKGDSSGKVQRTYMQFFSQIWTFVLFWIHSLFFPPSCIHSHRKTSPFFFPHPLTPPHRHMLLHSVLLFLCFHSLKDTSIDQSITTIDDFSSVNQLDWIILLGFQGTRNWNLITNVKIQTPALSSNGFWFKYCLINNLTDVVKQIDKIDQIKQIQRIFEYALII